MFESKEKTVLQNSFPKIPNQNGTEQISKPESNKNV